MGTGVGSGAGTGASADVGADVGAADKSGRNSDGRKSGRMRRVFATVAAVLVVAGVAGALAAFALGLWRPFPAERHDGSEFGIEQVRSSRDEDGDGVDDQTDLLLSARAYVETKPAYESVYYAGGRPDDGRGVCTDVVDQAMLGAGFDLRALVDADVRANPEAYDIEVPDANIDFRRVRNLRVWFGRHAQALDMDLGDPAVWQGGDIVCWREHIGVVSDVRNAKGLPFVIHHVSPRQTEYEEDVLESGAWGPIVGHWRLG